MTLNKQKVIEWLKNNIQESKRTFDPNYGHREAWSKLINEIESGFLDSEPSELQVENALLREALKFYADARNYHHVETAAYSNIVLDGGETAAIALSTKGTAT